MQKNTDELATLENDFHSKMRLRKIVNEMRQNNLEMELHRLKEESALKLKYDRETFDARESGFDDGAALSVRNRLLFIGRVQVARTAFDWL